MRSIFEERAVEVLEVGDHHLVPQVELLQIAHQKLVDDREFARKVRLHVKVLISRLDALRQAGDVRDGRRGRDREAVRVAHADLFDAPAEVLPVQSRRHVALDVAAALVREQLHGVDRQDAAIPERPFESRIRAALFGEIGRSPESGVGDLAPWNGRRTPPRQANRRARAACAGNPGKPMMPRPTGRCLKFELRAFPTE